MIFHRKRTREEPKPDVNLDRIKAEADREHLIAQRQAQVADTAVNALASTRLRNGFAPAIMAGIVSNRKDP